MLQRIAILLTGVLLFLVGCGGSEEARIVTPSVSVDHEFYFDAYYTKAIGGFEMFGTYIDSRGRIISYDHGFGPWQIASPWSVTVAEMANKFSVPTDSLGTVAPAILAEMFGKVGAAAQGDLIGPGYTGDGPGVTTYICHIYDAEVGGYTQVLFRQVGDYNRTNNSQEAGELVEWLKGLTQLVPGTEN